MDRAEADAGGGPARRPFHDNGYFDRGKIGLPDGAAVDAASVDIVIVDGTAEFARRIENAVALRVRSARTRAAHDVFDVAGADADIAQFMIRELRQFAHRVSIPTSSVELLRDHFEGDHLNSFSDAPRPLLGRKPIVAGAHGGRTAQFGKVSPRGPFSAAPRRLCSRTHRRLERSCPSHHAPFRRSSRRRRSQRT